MRGIHSWCGLLSGWLLFAVCLTGALTVFDNELTYWMQPELLEVSADAQDLLKTVQPVTASLVQVDRWDVPGFTDRPSVLTVKLQEKRTFSGQTLNPITGEIISFRDTQRGDFFYHFHYGLLFGWPGAWIVGIAAVVMLITLATGLYGHRSSIKDMVMVRLRSSPRAWVDAHNLTGVFAIPFHLMIAVTGLAMF